MTLQLPFMSYYGDKVAVVMTVIISQAPSSAALSLLPQTGSPTGVV